MVQKCAAYFRPMIDKLNSNALWHPVYRSISRIDTFLPNFAIPPLIPAVFPTYPIHERRKMSQLIHLRFRAGFKDEMTKLENSGQGVCKRDLEHRWNLDRTGTNQEMCNFKTDTKRMTCRIKLSYHIPPCPFENYFHKVP